MLFPFSVENLISSSGISVIEGSKKQPKVPAAQNHFQPIDHLDQVIDQMGAASAKAQGLKQIITQACKFFGTDQTLFIKASGNSCQAILKMGRKNLFHREMDGQIKEIKPLCVLDFYVHESIQRTGLGKLIFEYMLEHYKVYPSQLAYDRPSTKLLSFLRKHYNLVNYVPQNNNFVVYSQYWNKGSQQEKQTQQIQTQIKPQQFKQTQQQPTQQPSQTQSRNLLSDPKQQQKEKLSEEINTLTEQINQMNLQQTKQTPQPPQKLQTPWATSKDDFYQTTSKLMSAQIGIKR